MPLAEVEQLTLNNLLSPEILADPYPFFRRLREEDPVHWDPIRQDWVISRYDDVSFLLADPRVSVQRMIPWSQAEEKEDNVVYDVYSNQLLFSDPPDHTRLRALFSKVFTPQRFEDQRPRVLAWVAKYLDSAQKAGGMDFIRDFAFPLPLNVHGEIFGIPAEERAQMHEWCLISGKALSGPLTPDEKVEVENATRLLTRYFRDLVEERRHRPKDDMISDLAHAEEQGDRLSTEEIIANLIFVFLSGLTPHLLGNGLLTFWRHPDQWKLLCQDASLAPGAVTEVLRYAGPVQMTYRLALEDIEIGGRTLLKGQRISLLFAAANHDPEHFADPERFDIRRPPARILTYSHGFHTCMGAALASLEGEVVFSEVARRFPNLRLEVEQPQWKPSIHFRQSVTLPVTFGEIHAEAQASR